MSAFRTLDHADVKGQRVLVRADLNVPVENGVVTDASRIERMAPVITGIADKGGKVILLSHFGRPRGRNPKESLKPDKALGEFQRLETAAGFPQLNVEEQQPVTRKAEKLTSKQLEECVLETENRIGANLEKLEERVTLRDARRRAANEVRLHPARWGLAAAATGLLASIFVRRKFLL